MIFRASPNTDPEAEEGIVAEKEMTTGELQEFLKIPPEEHFRSREKALKAAGIWKALAEASTDPKVKEQWQSASENALKAAENRSPAKIHNAAIGAKKGLLAAKEGVDFSGDDGKRLEGYIDSLVGLMDMCINKPPKKSAAR